MRPHARSRRRFAARWLPALLLPLAIGCSGAPKPAAGPGGSSASSASSGSAPAKGWKPAVPDTAGPVVGVVGTKKITRHEIDSLIASAPASLQPQLREPDGYRQVVDQTITREAIYQAAVRDSVERDSLYQGELRRMSRDLLMKRYYQLALERVPEASDSAARAYYETHLGQYTVVARARIRTILLKTKSQAAAVRRSLEKGALWDETCRAKSQDAATRDNGGVIGYVTPGNDMIPGIGTAPSIVSAAFSLEIGAVSQPIQGPRGWYLVKVDSRQPETIQPYDDVKRGIVTQLTTEEQNAYAKTMVDSLRRYSNATIFDDSISVALNRPKSAADLFRDAQTATTPTQRIDLYRELIQRYPADSVSVQARFMIGFTYAEELREFDLARREFEEFLRLYPGSELATSAKWMLENMEKAPPDLDGEPNTPEPEPEGAPPGGGGGGGGSGGGKSSP